MTVVWTIAGSDSCAGAGIQADLKTFHALGAYGCTVITAVTAQNTREVRQVASMTPGMVLAQMEALDADTPPSAVKTGMLGDAHTVSTVARFLKERNCFVVCDPVMVATSGASLMDEQTRNALVGELLPRADLVTPNLPEAEALTGLTVKSAGDVVQAAEKILELGARSVLIKGGHGSGAICQDYWTNGQDAFWLNGPRAEVGNTHGSGCTLAAAVAACVGLGHELDDALVLGRAYVGEAVRAAKKMGGGAASVYQGGWPVHLPWLTPDAESGLQRPCFPSCGPEPLGFYLIVDSAAWLARLLPLGLKTVQLRVKHLEGDALEAEIKAAVDLARKHEARLFVNDYWQLAIQYGAYGVHLGQEDMETADLPALALAGVRLGLSTHSYRELARAFAVEASYLALGPIYETTTKVMRFGPQGLDRIQLWKQLFSQPLVAIGGINLERSKGVLDAGADSIAVVSAVLAAPDPEKETQVWLELFQ